MNQTTIKPNDLGLKDLEVFYNPEILFYEAGQPLFDSVFVRKTIITAAVIATLNCAPAIALTNGGIKAVNLSSVITPNVLNEIVNVIDTKTESFIDEVEHVVCNEKQTNFSSDEIKEMEIIDEYYKEARSFYPAKRKIVL